jgi:two-component system, OmpR family, sensor histidine kinase KdpD
VTRLPPLAVRGGRPSAPAGIAVAVAAVAVCTALIYPLRTVAPAVSLGVVYLLGVLVVSTLWGLRLGVPTALASAAAFNFFHLPPTGQFTVGKSENWVALAAFLVAAVATSTVAALARSRAEEAEARRQEADLAAEMARTLLRGDDLERALPTVARRLAQALDLPSAAIETHEIPTPPPHERRAALPLRDGERVLGTLLVRAGLPDATLARLREHLVPSLEALLGAALERDALLREVVETSALRRSDVLKTALLRAVSHDLRSPLTAILTAAGALSATSLQQVERDELVADITSEATRLARLVDKLLDLSRLEADSAEPRREWCSVEEVLLAAVDGLGAPPEAIALAIDADLPLIRADAAQLERAFANLLENAVRYSAGKPVSVRARAVRARILVRVVDRGPGVPRGELARIFEPFYRDAANGHRGSGLGLAIVRGFVEANGGTVRVESLPGQGTTFEIALPLEEAAS